MLLWGLEEVVEKQGLLLEELGMPFAVKGRHEDRHPNWIQIDYDHEGMMAESVYHLARLGHKRIFFIGFEPERIFQSRMIDGYKFAMAKTFGFPPPNDWIAAVAPGIEMAEEQMDWWLSLPKSEQPTAVVVGSSNNPMWGVERALAKVGRKLGNKPGDFSAAGMIKPETPLMFGHAYGYDRADSFLLAEAQALGQVMPLLKDGSCPDHILRVLPQLHSLNSMELGEVTDKS
jgi:DNA-binding LacI/PurR family transcriptional regulator